MTISDLLSSGGGVVGFILVLLALVEISPIKINPWTAIGKAIGRAINGDVIEKLEATRKTLDEHIKTDDARNADMQNIVMSAVMRKRQTETTHTIPTALIMTFRRLSLANGLRAAENERNPAPVHIRPIV